MTPLDRAHRPPPRELRPFVFPPFQRRVLSCGLTLYLAPSRETPLVELELLLPSGAQCDPIGQSGLASLHNDLLAEGSARHSSQEIAQRMESLGGGISTFASWDSSSIGVQLLSKHLEAGLDTFAELIHESIFPEEEIARILRQSRAEILRRAETPLYPTLKRLREMTFGDHPYSRMLIGSEESLSNLGREDCLAFHRRHVGPVGSFLIAVGDFDPEALVALVETYFGDWPKAEIGPLDPPQPPEARRGVRVSIIDRPGASQTELRLGHLGILRDAPDFAAALVANHVYGGSFTSRLNLNLRERHGMTYTVSSRFGMRRGIGPWVVSSAIETESIGLAVEEILREMHKMREEIVPTEELRNAQDYLVGVFPYSVQTIGEISARLEVLAVHDLPDDYYESYPANLGEVTPEEVLAASRRYFRPDDLGIVVSGAAEELLPQLEKFGPVEVIGADSAASESSADD